MNLYIVQMIVEAEDSQDAKNNFEVDPSVNLITVFTPKRINRKFWAKRLNKPELNEIRSNI
jgi:hypothetical protein